MGRVVANKEMVMVRRRQGSDVALVALTSRREAVCHSEFLEDLQHWIDTDRRTARRITQEHRWVYLVKNVRVDFPQGRYHY